MVQVSYPGVYIQEVPSGVRTITGVSTSIAAFLGRTSRGPLDQAVRCLSYADFERAFGGPHPQSDLPQSVRLFFENGGTDCFVVRLANGASAAGVTLLDLDSGNVLVARGKHAGLWTNGLRLEVDYDTPNPDESFNMTVIQMEGTREVARERHAALSMDPGSPRFAPPFVTQSSALVDVELDPGADLSLGSSGYSQSRPHITTPIGDAASGFREWFNSLIDASPDFELNVNDLGFNPISLATVFDTVVPADGVWTFEEMATRLSDLINAQLNVLQPGVSVTASWIGPGGAVNPAAGPGASPTSLRITAVPPLASSVRIRSARANDFAAPMRLGVANGGIEVTRHSAFRPVPTGAFLLGRTGLYTNPPFTGPINDFGALLVQMANLGRDDVTNLTIGTSPPVALNFTALGPTPTSEWLLDAAGNETGLREKLLALAEAINDAIAVPWRAELWGYHLALRATEGAVNAVPTGVTTGGATLLGDHMTPNVRQYTLGSTGSGPFQTDGVRGLDGDAPLLGDYLGSEAAQTGFHALDPVDLFNLMVLPGIGDGEATYAALLGPASTYCAEHRAFLIADAPATGPASWTDASGRPAIVQDTSLVKSLRAPMDKDHAAVYYPHLVYRDTDGLMKTIGPSGAIAGLMARIDSTRGVWKAPAGTEATIRGTLGMTVNLTDRENGVLNKVGVNALRILTSGFVSWGARTLDGDDDLASEWKYVPIRRLALFLEESLFRGTKWVVFEPNDEPLWASIRLNLNAFMMGLFRQGAFQGSTPREAFYVKCDRETTTQADRNLGIVNIEVGYAPLKPAEFVVIRIQQIAGDL